jgi:hypothetical protein
MDDGCLCMRSLDNASCGKFFDGLAMPGGDFKGAEKFLQAFQAMGTQWVCIQKKYDRR